MRTFDYEALVQRQRDTETVSYLSKIHECKGRQELYIRQKPMELTRLVEIAKLQSTESSNKIEGIVTTSTRMKQLFQLNLGAGISRQRRAEESAFTLYIDYVFTFL